MPITFRMAEKDLYYQLARVKEEHHSDLCDPDVTVDILFTQEFDPATQEESPTLKHRGYPAIAVIKKTSLRERVLGAADAQLTIDSVTWGRLTEKERDAVLDHELTHLQVIRDAEGRAVLDDHGRPKLTIRLHDWELGGFVEVARRHGKHAPEVRAVESCVDEHGQYFWDWSKPRRVA